MHNNGNLYVHIRHIVANKSFESDEQAVIYRRTSRDSVDWEILITVFSSTPSFRYGYTIQNKDA